MAVDSIEEVMEDVENGEEAFEPPAESSSSE